jgi:hypothetical protein
MIGWNLFKYFSVIILSANSFLKKESGMNVDISPKKIDLKPYFHFILYLRAQAHTQMIIEFSWGNLWMNFEGSQNFHGDGPSPWCKGGLSKGKIPPTFKD